MRRTAASLLALSVTATVCVAAPHASAATTAAACPEGEVPASGFTDVPAGSTDVDCLVWWGVTTGSTPTTYGGGPVSRAQMAAFLARTVSRGGGIVPAGAPDAFRDDSGNLHEAAANGLAQLGIVAGSGDGLFRPSDRVRRDQMASFLVRTAEHLLSRPLPSTPGAFPDDDGNVHEQAIERLAGAGIATGKADGSYDPSGLVTRTQMASFLVRTLDVVVRDRLHLVRPVANGVDPAAVTELVVVEGPTVRPVPAGGTLAVNPGARLHAPPVGEGASLRIPAVSPVEVGQPSFVQSVDLAYVEHDAAVADPANSASASAYFARWFARPAATVPSGWTGSVAGCDAGSTSQEFRDAQLDAVNAARRLVDLPAVREDPGWSAKAQEAALVMAAEGALSHAPPSSWSCWTPNAEEAAGRSNLALGYAGVEAVVGYLEDPGPGNEVAGHRRWILDRRSQRMGFGDVVDPGGWSAGAMWVIGEQAASPSDHVVTWPAPGYFPAQLLGEAGRWSVSAPDVDFAAASVTATVNGAPVTPVVQHGDAFGYGGEGALVFSVPGAGPFHAVSVTVSAPRPDGSRFEHSWTSTLVR